jgi:hypothetical protein
LSTLEERLSVLEQEVPEKRPCPMGAFLSTLPDSTRVKLVNILTTKISNRRIHSELQASGIRIARESLAAHRNGYCRCPKENK